MASAQSYPVTQKFGYDPSYPLHNGFHQGTDYGCPDGTPIVVNGVQIGLSGHTGTACWGPHCHVGKFDAAGNVLDSTGQGWAFTSAKVVSVSSDSINGNWVRVLGDGAYFVYLHMSQQTCRVGQVLQGAPAAPSKPVDGDNIVITNADNEFNRWAKLFVAIRGRQPSRDEFVINAVGQTWLHAIEILADNPEADNTQHAQEIGQLAQKDDWSGQIHGLEARVQAAEAPKLPFKYERLPNDGLNVQTKHDADVISLDDGTSKGIADKGTKFTAVGKATDQLSQTHAVYYMSAESFGDADVSGAPAHNQGINTIDLEPQTDNVPKPEKEITETSSEATATDDEHIDVKVVPASPDAWQNSYSDEGAGDYEAEADTIVHDLAGKVGDVKLAKGMPIKIAGTFTGPDFIKYRRTVKSVERGDWRGIPTAALKDDDGIFTYLDPLIDDFKEFKGQVSKRKKVIIATAKAHGEFNWLADRLKKKGSTK